MPPGAMTPESSVHAGARLRDALLIVVLAAALVLPPVGQRLIVTSHEARFALVADDMLERHVWFDARLRGLPYRNKPPLHPWSIVASSWWTGRVTEGSAQLPSALATIATVLGVFLLGDRLFGRRVGVWAAAVHATSYGVFAHSQMILPDMAMIALGVLAGSFFWRAVTGPGSRPAMVAFYGMLGLGMFTKGPAGLLPLAVAVVWLLSEHGVSGLRKLWSLPGVALLIALNLAWLIPFLTLGSERFVGAVVWWDWLYYYFRWPRPRAIGGQMIDFVIGFLPWTVLLPLAVVHTARTRSEPAVRFTILWFVVQFVLIMASTNQRVRYLLSLYPAAALLVAWWAFDDRRSHRPHRTLVVTGMVVIALAAVAMALAGPARPAEVPVHVSWVVPLAGLLLVVFGLAWGFWVGRPTILMTGMAAGMAVALASSIWLYNGWINATRDFKALAATVERHARGADVGAFVSKGDYLQIDFYLRRDLTPLMLLTELEAYVARPGRPLVVINAENWERWHRQLPPGLDVLETTVVGGEALRLVRARLTSPRQ
jgi:4-amino-4-deoxy-L-arabinose transferase-like glycosyltransferase